MMESERFSGWNDGTGTMGLARLEWQDWMERWDGSMGSEHNTMIKKKGPQSRQKKAI